MLLRGAPISDALSASAGAPEAVFSGGSDSRSRQGSVTPVPERLWAIRNVANSLARSGEGGEGPVSAFLVASSLQVTQEHAIVLYQLRLVLEREVGGAGLSLPSSN